MTDRASRDPTPRRGREVHGPSGPRRPARGDPPQRRDAGALLLPPRDDDEPRRSSSSRTTRRARSARCRRRLRAAEDRRGPRDGDRRARDRVGAGAGHEPRDRQDARRMRRSARGRGSRSSRSCASPSRSPAPSRPTSSKRATRSSPSAGSASTRVPPSFLAEQRPQGRVLGRNGRSPVRPASGPRTASLPVEEPLCSAGRCSRRKTGAGLRRLRSCRRSFGLLGVGALAVGGRSTVGCSPQRACSPSRSATPCRSGTPEAARTDCRPHGPRRCGTASPVRLLAPAQPATSNTTLP